MDMVTCKNCGESIEADAVFCPKCGCKQKDDAIVVVPNASVSGISGKSRLAASLLCAFLGGLGVHRFYVGKICTGILQIITLGGLGIWTLVDFIMICCGSFRDKQGNLVKNWMD